MLLFRSKAVLLGLATLWLGGSSLFALTFVEDFSTDPFAGGRFTVPTGDSNRFVYSAGKVTAEYNSTLPTAKYLHALGTTFTENDPFSMIFDVNIRSTGFFADPNEFAQIAFGLVNGITTGTDRAGGVNGDAFDTLTADYYPNISTFFESQTLSPTIITTSNNPNYFLHVNFTFGAETAIQTEFPSGLPQDLAMRFNLDYVPSNKMFSIRVSTNGTPLAINATGSGGVQFDGDPTTIQTFLGGGSAFALDSIGLLLWNDTFAGCCGGSGTAVVANVEFSYIEFTSPVPEPSSAVLIIAGMVAFAGIGMGLRSRHENPNS